QRLAASDQQLGLLVVAVGQLLVKLLQRVECPVVKVGGAFVGQARHRLVRRTSAVPHGLGSVSCPCTFEVVVRQLSQQLVGTGRVLQRGGDALMQTHAPHRCQLG